MIALGADVGSGLTGLTVLDGRRYIYRVSVEPDGVTDVLRGILQDFAIKRVGIETMSQVFEHGKGAKDPKVRRAIENALIASRDVAGKIRGIVEVLYPSILVCGDQAHKIRKVVIGRMPRAPKDVDARTHRDRVVAAFVHRCILGWPDGKGDNNHNRDAAVAALWVQGGVNGPMGSTR